MGFKDEEYGDWYSDNKETITEAFLEHYEEEYAEYCIHKFREYKKKRGMD